MGNACDKRRDVAERAADRNAAAEPDRGLPTPAERPGAAVVIYDGHCGFCCQQVARLARWDRRQKLAFLSHHDPECARRFPELPAEELAAQLLVLSPAGTAHGGATALRYLARRLPRLWPTLPLLYLPFSLPVWQWLYRQFAQRRTRGTHSPGCSNGCPR